MGPPESRWCKPTGSGNSWLEVQVALQLESIDQLLLDVAPTAQYHSSLGNGLGVRVIPKPSAENAIQSGALSRAFSAV